VWAAVGAASAVLALVVLARWLISGPHQVHAALGPDHLSTARLILLHTVEWGQFAIFVALALRYVILPLARKERLGFDGLFILAALLLNFWDPLDNYWAFVFQYNTHFLNISSWASFIPGWHSPGGAVWAVPVGFVFGAYVWAFYYASRIGCAILKRLSRTRPTWSAVSRFAVVFLAMAALEAVCELIYLRTDSIANIFTNTSLTIWSGHYYQWPIYNPILFASVWTLITALRWSRNADGLSFVERGAEQLRTTPRLQTWVRFLAISAYLQVVYIGLYFVPWNLLALHHGPPPLLPSYFPRPTH
jgi:hypothetical protein